MKNKNRVENRESLASEMTSDELGGEGSENRLSEDLKELAEKFQKLSANHKDTTNEADLLEFQQLVVKAVKVLAKHQKNPENQKFCVALNQICRVQNETSDKVRLSLKLKPVEQQIADLVN